MTRLFASDTSVPVDRTRAEINKLLTDWKCASIGWTDHLAENTVAVEFTWKKDESYYRVRFTIVVPKTKPPKNRWDRPSPLSENEKAQAWRSAHRLLLLKLKADLNAAQAGIAKAEEIFLPWMVDRNGKTIAEIIVPQLRENYAMALPAGPKEGT